MSEETLQIVGDMADKIKNNVKEQLRQFSWKMTFPKEFVVKDIPVDKIMILNKDLKRLRTEFTVSDKDNTIMITPQAPYKPEQEYYFWAKYKNKELCVAFTVTGENELNTLDKTTSLNKLNRLFKKQAKKVTAEEPSEPENPVSEASDE